MAYRYIGVDGITINIPEDAIGPCSCSGSNDAAVAYWVKRIEWPEGCEDTIRRCLKEYGAWTTEQLENDHDNIKRVLWLAAGDISDDKPGCIDDET